MRTIKDLIKREFYDRDGSRYLYMVGNITAVCVAVKEDRQMDTIVVNDKTYVRHARKLIPTGRVYIDFVELRDEGADTYVEEDSPATRGIDKALGKQIISEMTIALELLSRDDELRFATNVEIP